MKTLKEYVRNTERREASLTEGYVKDKCIGFVTKYSQTFEVVEQRVQNADEKYRDVEEVLEGVGTTYVVSTTLQDVAHKYALQNLSVMQPWLM